MGARTYQPVTLEPAIKWSGSKRSVANQISNLFPCSNAYIEPFVGGGSLLPFRPSSKALAGDVIGELIELWIQIRNNVECTVSQYESRWLRLQGEGHTAYYDIRDNFNQTRNPYIIRVLK